MPDNPPGGWAKWSNRSTWGSKTARIPGVDVPGANVTIPCGKAYLLDVPLVRLTLLDIQGALKFLDSPNLPLVNLSAAFVIVQGRLIIGSSAAQFSQQAVINLLPNPNGRAEYVYTSRAPADPAHPEFRSLGHKALAVVGGQVDLHGLPGPASMPVWVKLGASAGAGDLTVVVKGDVSSWPVGADIVIAPSSLYLDHEDVQTITDLTPLGGGLWQVGLDPGLNFNHYGDAFGIPDGFGGYIDETAEVALLTRNIVITGMDEPGPHYLEGGHFIVFMTNTRQIIEGVEFLMMGQQGHLGRYNIHFHICGNQQGNSIVRKNLMLHSKQRCVVVHATFNLTVDSNVAYNTSGHCYMIEEGGETGNTFIGNLGLRTRAVVKKIPLPTDASTSEETDDSPATFWITNPNNNYINNAAAGSENSGFWTEFRYQVRGISAMWAKLNNTVPIATTPVGTFRGNTAHSNSNAGYQGYPNGFFPAFNATQDNDWYNRPVWVSYGGFNLYKNMQSGAFLHNMNNVAFVNSSFADNLIGVNLAEVQGVNLSGHRFVGLTSSYGDPTDCDQSWGNCAPVSGCSFPLPPGVQGREVSWWGANASIFGVLYTQNRIYEDGTMVNSLSSSTFSSYDSSCHPAAAIAIDADREAYWNTGHGFRAIRMDTKAPTSPVYFYPRLLVYPDNSTVYAGEVATMYALRDFDGSVVGSPGGYVVANNSGILPPKTLSPACSAIPRSNALACPRTCYRAVQITFYEPAFLPYLNFPDYNHYTDGPRKLGLFSYFLLTRLADGKTLAVEGNLRQYGNIVSDLTFRVFTLSLLGGYTYELTLVPGTADPAFVPQNLTLQYVDGPGCGQGVTLRVRGVSGAKYSWTVPTSAQTAYLDPSGWAPCPGNAAIVTPAVTPFQYRYTCSSSSSPAIQALEFFMSPSLPSALPVILIPSGTAPPPCSSTARCGLVAANSAWAYNQLNQELHPPIPGAPAFYNPLYPTLPPDWQSGQGPLGYEGWEAPYMNTYLLPPDWQNRTVYYFRTSFNITNSKCYTSLTAELVVHPGVVLYLNNIELMRANMPPGPVTISSLPPTNPDSTTDRGFIYQTFNLPLAGSTVAYSLTEGRNYVAAEVHVNTDLAWDVGFALRLSGTLNTSCTGRKVGPELCDGIDNDGDGLIDADPVTKKPLTRPCATACGTGTETCIRGAYQSCTAPRVLPETCNGRDDNCDGAVDNGVGQLNCARGSVCYAGQCRPLIPLAVPQTVWGPGAANWYYFDKGGNIPSSYPKWKLGPSPLRLWKLGPGAFGTFPDNLTLAFATPLATQTSRGGAIYTRYFLKSFTLTPAEAASTYALVVGVRRVDGAVVYVNEQEVFRTNMPAGAVLWTTTAANDATSTNPTDDQNAMVYYPSRPLRTSGLNVSNGTNWVAAELHAYSQWSTNFVFDLSLTRYAVQTCPLGGLTCVRNPPLDTVLLPQGDTWRYTDASRALPPATWMKTSFVDIGWLQGPSPLGANGWDSVQTKIKLGTDLNSTRQTYYFRRTFTIPDGACYFNLTLSLLDNDGSVVYINGIEAVRDNLPPGVIGPSTPALQGGSWSYNTFLLSGGWVRRGVNVIAVELHQAPDSGSYIFFDLGLTGQREGSSCTPLPA